MQIRSFEAFQVGEKAEFSKTITESDIVLFAGISGDLNPLHLDEEHGKSTRFGGRIAHGVLTAGLVSASVTRLIGPGYVLLSMEHTFTAPVKIGDTITAEAEVHEKDNACEIVKVKTTCTNQRRETVLKGWARMMKLKELSVCPTYPTQLSRFRGVHDGRSSPDT